jgi:hypothetical protein
MSDFIDTVHPTLRPIVRDFLAKCNYPFELSVCGGYMLEVDGINYRSGVTFIDPNVTNIPTMFCNPATAGVIKLVYSNAGKEKFRIVTRNIQNGRARDAEHKKSVETLSSRRALKGMLTHITPIGLGELARDATGKADAAVREWKEEFSNTLYRAFRGAHNATIVEEVQHLQALGVEFKTPEFKYIAETAIAAFTESERRKSIRINKYFVKIQKDGSVGTIDPYQIITIFGKFETLPPYIQEAVGVLKLMDANKNIPEVGVNVGDNMFWVFQKVEE